MSCENLHSSLKSDIVSSSSKNNITFIHMKLQWGKDRIGYSLHVDPKQWTTSGLQTNDFLSYLGFIRCPCNFTGSECYARSVEDGFDLDSFVVAFSEGYDELLQAQNNLQSCGFRMPQPEGLGYFYGKESLGRLDFEGSGPRDGHTAPISNPLKQSEDDFFQFAFSWIENQDIRGWIFHYRPKHQPISSEFQSVFDFLGLRSFNECPLFNFEPCYWRFIAHQQRGDSYLDNNVSFVNANFDAHEDHFSTGIKSLLKSQQSVEAFDMYFLPMRANPRDRVRQDIQVSVKKSNKKSRKVKGEYKFDVAISFAGTERELAESLATAVRNAGFDVFYDAFYPEVLWGKDLAIHFDEVFRKNSRFCVIFISQEYLERMWTNHERRSAQARAIEEKGDEYILPVKVEDVELQGMPPTIGYLSIRDYNIEQISKILINKLSR